MTIHKAIMEWNTHPSTLVGTDLAPHYKRKVDFLDTLDLRGAVDIAEAEAKIQEYDHANETLRAHEHMDTSSASNSSHKHHVILLI